MKVARSEGVTSTELPETLDLFVREAMYQPAYSNAV